MPSQYGEHEFILQHFAGRIGRFLDVGAFDGITFSNTRCLADLGWSGVCVEPSPPAFCHLMKSYEGNPRVALVNAAVSPPSPRVQKFFCNTVDTHAADALSTFSTAHRQKFAAHPFREIYVSRVDWDELLTPFAGASFEFLNLDVEGLNAVALACAPLDLFEMVCVELDPADDQQAMFRVLKGAGFGNSRTIGGNCLAWRQ